MHLFAMRGAWGPISGWFYETVIGRRVGPLYDRFVAEALPELPDGSTIIDVGCGEGQVSSRIAAWLPACQVIGLDLSPAMIERASARTPPRDNLRFVQGDALALPLQDDSVDVAVSVASIKHWPDRLRGVRELLRVIRPGGTICVLEADRDCTHAAARRFTEHWLHVLPFDRDLGAVWFRRVVAGQALNLDELVGVLTRAGVADLQAERQADLPFIAARARKAAPRELSGEATV
jgi:SAM-dependent methyltransferase